MKRRMPYIIILSIALLTVVGIMLGSWYYSTRPEQQISGTFGITIPQGVTIASYKSEDGWDRRLYYGTLVTHSDELNGIVDPNNFVPLSGTTDQRVISLVKEVNETFSVDKVSPESPDVLYQRITIRGKSIFTVFYNTNSQEYFFYGTRYPWP